MKTKILCVQEGKKRHVGLVRERTCPERVEYAAVESAAWRIPSLGIGSRERWKFDMRAVCSLLG